MIRVLYEVEYEEDEDDEFQWNKNHQFWFLKYTVIRQADRADERIA